MNKKIPTVLFLAILLIFGGGICLAFYYSYRVPAQDLASAVLINNQAIAPAVTEITYLVSEEDPEKYCNGADMDSAGYQRTITVERSVDITKTNPTKIQIVKATIEAATSGMCRKALSQLEITEKDGIVYIPPLDAWAGISITLCSCKPLVDTNLLQIPGVTRVIWSSDRNNESTKDNLISLEYPLPNQVISSPLVIKGQARGSWFFEASFPVFLVDWDGRIIAQGVAQAKGDWMTTEFVPFETILTFTPDKTAYSNHGAIILKKDNPSGLPANDDALEVPVIID